MGAPAVSCFIPCYNKGPWVLDALRSVFGQTRADWEIWLLENSNDDGVTRGFIDRELDSQPPGIVARIHYEKLGPSERIERIRREKYMSCWLMNCYYPEALGRYIFHLADDDIIDPDCFEKMAGDLDAVPAHQVVYCSLRHGTPTGPGDLGPWPDVGLPAFSPRQFPGSVDGQLDGGQIMHRKSCLDDLAYPYFDENPEGASARHSDGIFMERLVSRFPFWPVQDYLVTHRWTPLSVWSKAP